MRKGFQIIHLFILNIIVLLLFLGPLGFGIEKQDLSQRDFNIDIALFGTEGCESCQEVKEFLLPALIEQYPQMKVHYFDLDSLENYQRLLQLEKTYHRETNESPVLVIGDYLLAGRGEIENNLERYVQRYIQQEGCSLPIVEESKIVQQARTHSPPVYMAFFTKPGCKKCDRTQSSLKYLKSKYPHLYIKQFDVSQTENILAQQIMAEKIGLPEKKALLAPMVMVGERFLALKDLTCGNLESLILNYQASGSTCLWADISLDDRSCSKISKKIAGRFQKLGPLAIFGSGFLDGINPCAFATIIFLISWLAFIGKKGKDLLWVGSSFTLAVFLTYFLLGLGMFQFLKQISMLSSLRFIIFLVMAVGTFIFGILSIRDFFKVRQGKTREVSLQLPKILKKRIHRVIKDKTNVRGVVTAAFVMGIVISLLELACTGQVYLPTIMVVTGIPELKLHALSYLALYNLAFILPLAGVFLVTYGGSSSKQLAEVMERHLAMTKLFTGLFFFLMTLVLIATLFLL